MGDVAAGGDAEGQRLAAADAGVGALDLRQGAQLAAPSAGRRHRSRSIVVAGGIVRVTSTSLWSPLGKKSKPISPGREEGEAGGKGRQPKGDHSPPHADRAWKTSANAAARHPE